MAQATDCSASSFRPHSHPVFWTLAGAMFLIIPGIILWRYSALKQFQRLQNAQAMLQVFNVELSREIRQRQQIEHLPQKTATWKLVTVKGLRLNI